MKSSELAHTIGLSLTGQALVSAQIDSGKVIRAKQLNSRTRQLLVGLASVLLLLAVFGLDWLAVARVPFGPYYLLPIGLSAWYLSAAPTAALVVAASIGRTVVLGRLLPAASIVYYGMDVTTSLLVYAAVAILAVRLRNANMALAAQAQLLRKHAADAEQRLRLQWSIRRAVGSDLEAILELTVLGAETGDLSKEVLTQVRQQALRMSYAASIHHGQGARRTWRGEQATVPIEFWVSHLNGKMAGYFMVIGLDSQRGPERELHAIVTSKQFRGLGVGSAMVDFFCAHYHGRRLYAACMPDSTMFKMLSTRGFRRCADTQEGYVLVERADWDAAPSAVDQSPLEACRN